MRMIFCPLRERTSVISRYLFDRRQNLIWSGDSIRPIIEKHFYNWLWDKLLHFLFKSLRRYLSEVECSSNCSPDGLQLLHSS